jgi:hypothetical protein
MPEGQPRTTFLVYYGGRQHEFDTSNRMRSEKIYTALTDEAPYIHLDQSNRDIVNPDIKIQERAYTYGNTEQPLSIV